MLRPTKRRGLRVPGKAELSETINGLLRVGAPLVVCLLAACLFNVHGLDLQQGLAFIEYFAGKQAVTNAQLRAGRPAVAFEIEVDGVKLEEMDLMSSLGMAHAATLVLKLSHVFPGGVLMAPVCSTWVWISRGSTGRRDWRPLGDNTAKVNEANAMVVRVLSLLFMVSAMGLFWIVEQPSTSLMELHPHWQWFITVVPVFRHTIHMRDFGGESQKGTYLDCSHSFISGIDEFRCPSKVPAKPDLQVSRKYIDSNGISRVSGGQDLKGTQVYPEGFGKAVLKLQLKHQERLLGEAKRAKELNKFTPDVTSYTTKASHANENGWWAKAANFAPVFQQFSGHL